MYKNTCIARFINHVPHASGSHTPGGRPLARPSGQGNIPTNQPDVVVRGPPGRSKETTGGCRQQPSHPQPFPRQRRRQAQPLARARRRRQLRELQDYRKIMSGRWPTNLAGLAGRGAGVEGMGCATAGPAFAGLCYTQETTSGPRIRYADCGEEPTVKAASSSHIRFRTHEPSPCCDSHQLPRQC